jgi:hypothetical protein
MGESACLRAHGLVRLASRDTPPAKISTLAASLDLLKFLHSFECNTAASTELPHSGNQAALGESRC